jgi:O-succinylbenzoic acid--CoA ligase
MFPLQRPDGILSATEVSHRAFGIARALHQQGLQAGDIVAVKAETSLLLILSLLACWQTGFIALPLNPKLPESQRQELAARLPIRAWLGWPGAWDWSALDQIRRAPAPLGTLPENTPATLVLTSGSSGPPKAALHSLGNHFANARGSTHHIPFGPDDTWLLSLPLYHVGGLSLLFRAWACGGTLALPAPDQPLTAALSTLRPTHLSLVSTQLYRLQQAPYIPSGLKALLLGGSALPTGLLAWAYERGIPVHSSYGSTEMASQISSTRPGASLQALQTTAGYILPHRELKLASDQEIWVRGNTLFQGYWQDTGPILPQQKGWFATGDLGRWSPEGALQVIGRKDWMFISGGENIQPEEVEKALCRLPEIAEARVVPIPHPEFGLRPVAFVRAWQQVPAPESLREQLRAFLPGYKIPDHFLPWPEDLATQGLKINRQALIQRAENRLC